MSIKKQIIDKILDTEGSYVDDPKDSGGETNFGITIVTARANGYLGAMVDMPREVAYNIYADKYWHAVKGDELFKLAPEVAAEVVDSAVNIGPPRASLFLQRALNVLNRAEKLYQDIPVDGKIGPGTLAALAAYLDARGEFVLYTALNCLQGAFYIELAERREKDERFVYGWLQHRVMV